MAVASDMRCTPEIVHAPPCPHDRPRNPALRSEDCLCLCRSLFYFWACPSLRALPSFPTDETKRVGERREGGEGGEDERHATASLLASPSHAALPRSRARSSPLPSIPYPRSFVPPLWKRKSASLTLFSLSPSLSHAEATRRSGGCERASERVRRDVLSNAKKVQF